MEISRSVTVRQRFIGIKDDSDENGSRMSTARIGTVRIVSSSRSAPRETRNVGGISNYIYIARGSDIGL